MIYNSKVRCTFVGIYLLNLLSDELFETLNLLEISPAINAQFVQHFTQ